MVMIACFKLFQATPLHYAADSNRFEAVKFLLLIQADLHATDQFNRSPLYRAREAGHKEIRKLFVQKIRLGNGESDATRC